MTHDIHRTAEKHAHELATDAADQFEATILHNLVHDTVKGQHTRENDLIRTLDLAERAYDLSDETDTDGLDSAAFDAAESLHDVVEQLVADCVAEACATIVLDGDEWTDTWDAADVHAAQAEAREWLGDHLDVAERVGVLKDVRAKAVEAW